MLVCCWNVGTDDWTAERAIIASIELVWVDYENIELNEWWKLRLFPRNEFKLIKMINFFYF